MAWLPPEINLGLGLLNRSEQLMQQAMTALQEMDRYCTEKFKGVLVKECYKWFSISLRYLDGSGSSPPEKEKREREKETSRHSQTRQTA